MSDAEIIPLGFFFQIAQSRVWYVIQAALIKYFQERVVVNHHNEVSTTKGEVACFVQCISNCLCFTFHWCVMRFCH